MKEYVIPKAQEGQKVMRFLNRILPNASNSFLYKMFRKKNITINGKKISGNEALKAGDSVKIFFSDETFDKFAGAKQNETFDYSKLDTSQLDICYEDEDIIVCNKPYDMLSQKSSKTDISINELLIAYLVKKHEINDSDLAAFKPSVINRLDRNTTGLILFGKTRAGLEKGASLMKGHECRKTYHCIVKGRYEGPERIEGYLVKDEKSNTVAFSREEKPGSKFMSQDVEVLEYRNESTLLSVVLNTGRSHQIRSSLSAIGYPIAGDPKYGDSKWNESLRKSGIKSQLLHSYSIIIDGKEIKANKPADFDKVK